MSAAVENSRPVVALIRLLGWVTSAPSRRQESARRLTTLAAPSRRQDAYDRSHATQTPAAPLCSHLGCAGAVVSAPHGWAVCSEHAPAGVMIAAR